MANNASTRTTIGQGQAEGRMTPAITRGFGGRQGASNLPRVRWRFVQPANDNRRPLVSTLQLAFTRIFVPLTLLALLIYWQLG